MKGLVIWILRGSESDESVLDELGKEIGDRGGRVEVFHSGTLKNLGMTDNHEAKVAACAMVASHGVVVIASGNKSSGIPSGPELAVREVSMDDLRDEVRRASFMRNLELGGLVPPPRHDVHPDEEKKILARLKELGYLEE